MTHFEEIPTPKRRKMQGRDGMLMGRHASISPQTSPKKPDWGHDHGQSVFGKGLSGDRVNLFDVNASGGFHMRRTDKDRRRPRSVVTGQIMGDPKPGRFNFNERKAA